MLHETETEEQRAQRAAIEAQSVSLCEIGSWYAPWALGVILVLVFLGALWIASAATDDGGYVVGLIGAIVALAALTWEIEAALSGRPVTLSRSITVDDPVSLLVAIVLLAILAIVGLMLASGGTSPSTSGVGYGLALFGVVLIFINIKHYFDAQEGP